MIAARRFGHLRPVHTTNYLPALDQEACNGCGKCVAACPVAALGLVAAHDPARPSGKKARLDEGLCLGCGVCVRSCPKEAIALRERAERVLTPLNSTHRVVMMALERGTFAELLVDGQRSFGHRAVAAILGALLKMPPLKQALATKQVKSRYLEALVAASAEGRT
jgi:ferredoxin